MGYGIGAINMLHGWLGQLVQTNGSLLELGSQDINHDVPLESIRNVLTKLHDDEKICDQLIAKHFQLGTVWKVANLFRMSGVRYAALDIYAGDSIIEADLNSFIVPPALRNSFDLITNFGTTEHVTDQVNAFRVIHDFLKPGGCFFHSVPFAGYFNHGLYNYHPVFFVFLSHANGYQIELINLSAPHLEYNIPVVQWLPGSEHWGDTLFKSGIVSCLLRKIHDKPFRMFTDFDRSVIAGESQPELGSMVRDRYDLRVRD